MHHRRLDFGVATRVKEVPDFADDQSALQKRLARLLRGDQIEIPLAVANLDVRQAVPLFRERQQRLSQKLELGDPDGELVGLRAEEMSRDADHVTHVQQLEKLEAAVADHVQLAINLELGALPLDVRESRFAVEAQRDDASRDANLDVFGFKFGGSAIDVALDHLRGRQRPIEFVRVRSVAKRNNLFEFLLALEVLVEWLKRQAQSLSAGRESCNASSPQIERQYNERTPAASRKRHGPEI